MLNWFSGHYWTLGPHVSKALRPSPPPASRLFATDVSDPRYGKVRLTGRLAEPDDARALLIVVHGLGGWSRSKYVFAATQAAHARGLATLRLNLRGADRLGEDFYHAGQAGDLAHVVGAPQLARFDRIYVLGYSIGGHVALRYAAEGVEPRVRAVASLCAPLDLEQSARAIDSPSRAGYRRYVLGGLKEMFEALAARREPPLAARKARAIRTLREWDGRIVAPRYGFGSAEEYYERVSAGPVLGRIAVPTLVVSARHDPMILARTVQPWLERTPPEVRSVWIDRGGHVGFPAGADLGQPGPKGMEPQVISWLEQHA